jgi:hypothetical protein
MTIGFRRRDEDAAAQRSCSDFKPGRQVSHSLKFLIWTYAFKFTSQSRKSVFSPYGTERANSWLYNIIHKFFEQIQIIQPHLTQEHAHSLPHPHTPTAKHNMPKNRGRTYVTACAVKVAEASGTGPILHALPSCLFHPHVLPPTPSYLLSTSPCLLPFLPSMPLYFFPAV